MPCPLSGHAHTGRMLGRKGLQMPSRVCIPGTWDLVLAAFKGKGGGTRKEALLPRATQRTLLCVSFFS